MVQMWNVPHCVPPTAPPTSCVNRKCAAEGGVRSQVAVWSTLVLCVAEDTGKWPFVVLKVAFLNVVC